MTDRPSLDRDTVLRALTARAEDLRAMGVTHIGVFGSVARGQAAPNSDLDVLVELRTKSFDAYMDVKEFLEDLFDRPVDLVVADALKPRLRLHILRETTYAAGL
jgi:predicted nucleotidyltransferase